MKEKSIVIDKNNSQILTISNNRNSKKYII